MNFLVLRTTSEYCVLVFAALITSPYSSCSIQGAEHVSYRLNDAKDFVEVLPLIVKYIFTSRILYIEIMPMLYLSIAFDDGVQRCPAPCAVGPKGLGLSARETTPLD